MGARLTAKVGPLPVWAWALLLFVGVALAVRFTRAGGGTAPTTDTTTPATTPVGAIDSDTTPVGSDTGSPPAASGQGGAADNLNDALYAQLAGVSASVDSLSALVQTSPAFWSFSDAGAGSMIPSDGSKAQAPATAAKTAQAPVKAPAKPTPAAPGKAPTYYTYKPGNAPKGKKAQEAPARGPAGTTLHFRAGRGYYYA